MQLFGKKQIIAKFVDDVSRYCERRLLCEVVPMQVNSKVGLVYPC